LVVDVDIRAVHQNHSRSGIRSGGNLHRQPVELVLVLAQSEHVPRNLVNSLIVAPRHQAAIWLLAVSAAKQQPAASSLFGAPPHMYATIC
jgi:hypothetical protein